jgi:integrase
MVAVNVRYIVERQNKNGSVRRYWVRPGYDPERLPETGWAERAEHLNNQADAGKQPKRKVRGKPVPNLGTIGYWCDLYENTTQASVGVARPFQSLAYNTRENYLRQLGLIKKKLGPIPLDGITRKVLVEYLETVPGTVALRRISRNVWLNIFSLAAARGGTRDNPAAGLILAANRRRTELWMPDDIAAWMRFCKTDRGGSRWRMMFMLLLYTGQRIGDVLAMTWTDYDGDYIKVVQEKTKAKAEVYCHRALKAELESWRASQKILGATILTRYDGKPLSYNRVRNRTTEILTAIERRHLQLRDLRRTAATTLAEAGCTTAQIAAITGHSIERCQRILDTYVVRTRATAKAAIEKLEDFERATAVPGSAEGEPFQIKE